MAAITRFRPDARCSWFCRVHDPKREVVIYDYVDRDVPVLARMAAKRAAGYSAIGYTTAQGPGLFDR
jgi:hypothetical protein